MKYSIFRHHLSRRGMPALLGLVCGLAIMLALATASASASGTPAPRRSGSEDDPPGRLAAWDVVDAPAPHSAPVPATAAPEATATAAPTTCLGSPVRQIRYTVADGVIHLEGCGQTFRLGDLPAAGIGADKLERVDAANKIWLLKVKLKVEEGAKLSVVGGAAGDARELRLLSTPTAGVWLRAENGSLLFQDTKVISWDSAKHGPDSDPNVTADGKGGRAYIATRTVLTKGRATAAPTACSVSGGSREPYEGRMDMVNSEFGYLGYDAGESYGVSWKVYYKVNAADPTDAPPPGRQLYAMADVFGNVTSSSFDHNYYGSYTYGGYCMHWSGNTFTNNVKYGLDPHDDSDYLMIDRNDFHDNGAHGVICSIECDHIVITNNISYRNDHGIMLHRHVDSALVEGNISRDNRGAGIAIFDSHNGIVRNNTVTNNAEAAVRLSVGSSGNLIEGNTLSGLAAGATGPGYVISTYKGTDAPASGDGRPKNNMFRGNMLAGYKSPLMNIVEATGNVFEGNTIAGAINDIAFSMATGNVVRNSRLGEQLQIRLDSASGVALQDTRGAVWLLSQPGLGATVTPAGSTLNLSYATAGAGVLATPIDLTARPQNGAISIKTAAWNATARSWSESSSSTIGAVAHGAGGLAAGACYGVIANGKSLGSFTAGPDGRIAFSYGAGYRKAVSFTLATSSQCKTPGRAPQDKVVFLPLITR